MERRRSKKSSAFSRFFYRLRYGLGAYVLRIFISILGRLPDRLVVSASTFWAWITHKLLWKYRIRMEKNISVAAGDRFPDKVERKAMVWRIWKSFTRGLFEAGALIHFPKEAILAKIRVEGEQHLRDALARRKGVLALSAHLGNFALIGARLAAAGYPFSVVVKHPSNDEFARLITQYRAQVGIDTIAAKPRREAVRAIVRALRENRIVLVVADEFKSGEITVEFMGQALPAPRGPATLALRTGAVTLPMFATRQRDDSIVLEIGRPIEAVHRESLEETITATTALYTRHLEDAIYRYPDQWSWLGFPRKGRIVRAEMFNSRPSRTEANATHRAS
ncbi:MAG TPA: lysophospholipid acyltransferase family protein [Candidatus Binatia bacterium]